MQNTLDLISFAKFVIQQRMKVLGIQFSTLPEDKLEAAAIQLILEWRKATR